MRPRPVKSHRNLGRLPPLDERIGDLELVNLHVCAAVPNNSYFELLTPVDQFAFGLKEPIPITDGIATLPEGPGLGIEFDWDLIDRATYKVL